MAMFRDSLSATIAVLALGLGVLSITRGQVWVGGLLIVIALLRGGILLWEKWPRKPQPAIRLNLEEEPPFVGRYPKLPDHLQPQLDAITPSVDGDMKYYPCKVRLHDGSEIDHVYLVAEAPYIRNWGVYPREDPHKAEVLAGDIASLAESPSRLPARFANELYKAGESGMGYTLFTVVFADGSRQAYSAGNAIDFIEYPPGKGPQDVAQVLPHEGRSDKHRIDAPDFHWCIYSD